jgi:hypothetical protein
LYPAGKKDYSYAIPDSVTRIEDEAFRGCTSLTSVTIPDSVTNIGYAAFDSCANCTVPCYNGTIDTKKERDEIWGKYYTATPQRQRQLVGQSKIVKKA